VWSQIVPRRLDTSSKQKALILEKAGALFWDRGYDNTSIRQIARDCGFESSNIYYYFRNKEHILFELISEEINQVVRSIKHLEGDESGSPVDRLRSLIKIHCDLTLKNRRSSLRLLPDTELKRLSPRHRASIIRARDAYDRILRKIIRSGIDRGDFAQIDEKLADFSIASVIVRSRIWFSPKGKYTVEEIADFIFNFVTKGLAGLKPHVNEQQY
jgi:AcrR family transcriptional regulator